MNAIRSEWTKLRSVRSTWLTVLSTVLSAVALGVLGATSVSEGELPVPWDPTAESLKGFLFAQLVIGMLGAMSITPEYDTGMIGTSLATVPSRSRLLAAKAVVVGLLALATSLVTTLLSFVVVQALLGGADVPTASVTDPGVAGALVGATLYLTLVALLGVAVGTFTRSTTSSLAVLVGALLLVPALGPGLPGPLGQAFGPYWPITAGQGVYQLAADGALAPWAGLGLLATVTLVVTVESHVLLRLRDV